MLIVTDPPRHTRMRQIINKRFSKAALAPQESHIRAIATEILDSVTRRVNAISWSMSPPSCPPPLSAR